MVGPSAGPSPWFFLFQTCFLDVWRLPEVHPVGFHLGHTKDRTSGPLPPRWKTLGYA